LSSADDLVMGYPEMGAHTGQGWRADRNV